MSELKVNKPERIAFLFMLRSVQSEFSPFLSLLQFVSWITPKIMNEFLSKIMWEGFFIDLGVNPDYFFDSRSLFGSGIVCR